MEAQVREWMEIQATQLKTDQMREKRREERREKRIMEMREMMLQLSLLPLPLPLPNLKRLLSGMDGTGNVAQAKRQSTMVRPQDPVFEQKNAITKRYLNS